MKKEVVKVDKLVPSTEKIYNLTKQEAMDRLITEGFKSEQMLNKWCRDGLIDAVRISKGAPKNRGIRISEESLNTFIAKKIAKKSGKIDELSSMLDTKVNEIKELKQQLAKAQNEIRILNENQGNSPTNSQKNVNIQDFFLFTDLAEATFEYHNEHYSALFDTSTDEIIQITKKRKGASPIEVTGTFTEIEKKAILEIRKQEMSAYVVKD